MVLAPCGPLFEGGDVPERETAGEVDDSQQGTIGAETHAKHTVLDNTNARIFFNKDNFVRLLKLVISKQAERAALPFHPLVWKRA